jgi:hypothetical protein
VHFLAAQVAATVFDSMDRSNWIRAIFTTEELSYVTAIKT